MSTAWIFTPPTRLQLHASVANHLSWWAPRWAAFLSLGGDVSQRPMRMIEASRNVDVPIMLVRGRESNVVTEDAVKAFLETVPHAHYVDVAEARHMVVGDRNEVFTRAVVEFIDGLA
ncbi:MAG: alpha/beta hydrolase [Halioglobus sp.]|nr:alpha/beta hydrolase [Halioglobus sp.]